MKALLAISRGIDAINFRIGKWVSWLIVLAVTVSALNATIRKVFDTSSNAWLELQWVLFGIVFLLCSPWTLMSNEHIRIDIINAMFPQRLRNAPCRGVDVNRARMQRHAIARQHLHAAALIDPQG